MFSKKIENLDEVKPKPEVLDDAPKKVPFKIYFNENVEKAENFEKKINK